MSYDDTRSRKLPASAGIDWFLQGLKAARMAPISMLGVVLFYLLVMGGLSSLPLAGTVIAASILYAVAFSVVTQVSLLEAMGLSSMGQTVTSIVMIFVNKIYFDQRAFMFTN